MSFSWDIIRKLRICKTSLNRNRLILKFAHPQTAEKVFRISLGADISDEIGSVPSNIIVEDKTDKLLDATLYAFVEDRSVRGFRKRYRLYYDSTHFIPITFDEDAEINWKIRDCKDAIPIDYLDHGLIDFP